MIKDLKVGGNVSGIFLVRDVSFGTMKKGGSYAKAVLSDSSGTIAAVQWGITNANRKTWQLGSPIFVTGKVDNYEGSLQVVASVVDTPAKDAVKPEDLYPRCSKTAAELWAVFDECMAYAQRTTSHAVLKDLVEQSMELIQQSPQWHLPFERSPAAKRMHHAYVGGLLEHTVGVMKLVQAICIVQKGSIEPAIAMVGAAFHDIGKVIEYRVDGTLTDCGKLWGHSHAGAVIVQNNLGLNGVSTGIRWLVSHIILSHHGRLEWGAIVEPKTAEAFTVHMADLLDVRLWAVADESGKASGWQKIACFGSEVLLNWPEYLKIGS